MYGCPLHVYPPSIPSDYFLPPPSYLPTRSSCLRCGGDHTVGSLAPPWPFSLSLSHQHHETMLIDAVHAHARTQNQKPDHTLMKARNEGEAEAERVKAFLESTEGAVPALEARVAPWNVLRK